MSTLVLLGWIGVQGKDKKKCDADRYLSYFHSSDCCLREGMAQLFLLSLFVLFFPFLYFSCSALVVPDLSRIVCNKGLSVMH